MSVDYLPVATGAGANVDKQANFNGAGYRELGFANGTANPTQANKIWRQASVMVAALANFIANTLRISVLDDGNISALITNLTNAITTAAAAAAATVVPAIIAATVVPAVIAWPSRSLNTLYQNTTGRNLFVSTTVIGHATTFTLAAGTTSGLGSTLASVNTSDAGASANLQICAMIPPGWYYNVEGSGSVGSGTWVETTI